MSLNRQEILQTVQDLPYNKESFWLVMGSAMVMWEIKDSTSDIDIGCSKELFKYLLEQGFSNQMSRSGRWRIDYNSQIHFYLEWSVENLVVIDNIQVADIDSIVNDKKRFKRSKDIQDLSLIQEYLKDV